MIYAPDYDEPDCCRCKHVTDNNHYCKYCGPKYGWNMYNTNLTIAFTGRRPKDLVGYDKKNYNQFLDQLTEILKSYGPDTTFICGGAQGFDQLAFIAAERLKSIFPVNLHLYIPFEGQEKSWLTDGFFGQKMYNYQKDRADVVKYISKLPQNAEYHEVVKALYKRNEAMVDDADMIIALYPDDSWKTSKGGTAGCIRYAINKKPVYQLKYKIDDILTITDDLILLNDV